MNPSPLLFIGLLTDQAAVSYWKLCLNYDLVQQSLHNINITVDLMLNWDISNHRPYSKPNKSLCFMIQMNWLSILLSSDVQWFDIELLTITEGNVQWSVASLKCSQNNLIAKLEYR